MSSHAEPTKPWKGRWAVVSAEDIVRMKKYLEEQGVVGAEYVDVRVEGKGYYK